MAEKSKTETTLKAAFGGVGESQVMSSESSSEGPFLRCSVSTYRSGVEGSTIILLMTEDSKAQKG